MKSKNLPCIAMTLLTVAMPVLLAAEDNAKLAHPHGYHHYQLADVGTFGGPQSWMTNPAVVRLGLLNNQGTLTGEADTSVVDPYCFWSPPDCYATNAFQWKNGGKTDLGVLPGCIGSAVNWISANGSMVGIADNGQHPIRITQLPNSHRTSQAAKLIFVIREGSCFSSSLPSLLIFASSQLSSAPTSIAKPVQ